MPSTRHRQFRDRLHHGLLVLAVFLILLTSIISVRSTNALRDSVDLIQDALNVKDIISQFRSVSTESESFGLRYLISGRADYLTRFQSESEKLDALLGELHQLIEGNEVQQSHFARLIELQKLRRERIKKILELKLSALRVGSNVEIEAMVRDGKGAEVIGEIRSLLTQMTIEEDRLLDRRLDHRHVLVKQANATVLTTNSLALAAGILGFIAIRRARHESEKALRTELKAAKANRASEEKSVFLANMSHEIRTPMNAILGFTQLLSESVTAPVQRDWVQAIKKSGQLLLSLINNVLDVSKIEAGKLKLNPQPTDLKQLVDETIELFSTQAADKGIDLIAEIDEATLTTVAVDAQRLRQMIMNLVSNAVKYTEQGGVIVRLSMSVPADARLRDLHLLVIDTGVGIADEQRSRIFEPFHQAESPDGKIRQGTGLGLSITRRLVDLMNGRINIESQLGAGSTFLVELPRLPVSGKSVATKIHDEESVDFNRLSPLKILVVDDMAWNAQVAQGYLGKSHHSVYIAADGVEGVEVAKNIRPDVILMDLRMPRMSGLDARDKIRAEPGLRRTPIIAVTASSLRGEEKALSSSFDGYIRKPYTPLDLFVALEEVFGSNPPAQQLTLIPVNLSPKIAVITPELLQRWNRIRCEVPVELRRSMRMREISGFAQELRILGTELAWPQLLEYANLLSDAVRRFDVVAVKKLLSDLAHWPEELPDDF